MGGYHVTIRRAVGNYIKVNSALKLPCKCVSVPDSSVTSYDGVFPEFCHGFYKGRYGLDTGLLYNRYGDQMWHIFHGGLADTMVSGSWVQSTGFVLALNTSIRLDSFIDVAKQQIVTRVLETDGKLIRLLSAKLTDAAFATMAAGCDITRELLMATNRNTNVIPCDAVFEFAKFYDAYLYTAAEPTKQVPFVNGVEHAKGDPNVPFYPWRLHTLCINEVYNGLKYGCEVGSCSFQAATNDKINWEYPF